MNNHSNRIIDYMHILISKYRDGEINLSYLIDSLEGSINALEEKLPFDWNEKWVMNMIELETYLALRLETEGKLEILETLVELDQLIQELSGVFCRGNIS